MKSAKNKIAKRNGYSLVEVIVSITLIALLATAVAVFMQYWHQIRTLSNDMTIALNDAQKAIENEYARVRRIIDANITEELEDLPSTTVDVFEFRVTVYPVSGSAMVRSGQDVGSIKLSGGLAYTYKSEPKIPQIKSAKLVSLKDSSVDVIYFPESKDGVKVQDIQLDGSYTNLKKYIYWWYVGGANNHVLPLPGESMGEFSDIVPICPQDFTLLGDEREDYVTFNDLSKYKGRLIASLVIPGTIEGYMGQSFATNYIYVSALPNIGKYVAVYDASVLSANDKNYISETDGIVTVNDLPSEIEYNNSTKLMLRHTGTVYLDKASDGTQSSPSAGTYPSRYFSYSADSLSRITITSSNSFRTGTVIHAFAVANAGSGDAFLKWVSGSTTTGILTGQTNPDDEHEWKIYYGSIQVSGAGSFEVGGTDVNIAELIITANANGTEVTEIVNYLAEKYGIK